MSQNIRQELTEKFVAAIENGCPPWRAGWSMASPPMNPSSGKAYTGVNRLLLMQAVADANGDFRFMTLKQASAMGYKIRKGAKALRIVRVAEVPRKNDEGLPEDGEVVAEDKGTRLIMKVHSVFNGTDIEGLPPLEQPANAIEPVEAAENVVEGMKATGLIVIEGGDKAYYSPKADTVCMPDRWRFKGGNNGTATAEWWSTLLHECGHATMSDKRMSRAAGKFGTQSYSREELRVEIASAFLCQELGVPMAASLFESHAAYLADWASVLRSDPQEIFKAASEAQRIADYLKAHALQPEIIGDEKSIPADIAPPVSTLHVVAEAANQENRTRRRIGMKA